MNIFVTHPSPWVSAKFLDDVRKNKMILESAQLLSALTNRKGVDLGVYKTTHEHHPCLHWIEASHANAIWLCLHAQALYKQRGLPHKSFDIVETCTEWIYCNPDAFPTRERTPFNNSAANGDLGISYKHIPDTILAYRLYLRHRWAIDTIELTWNYGTKPNWRL